MSKFVRTYWLIFSLSTIVGVTLAFEERPSKNISPSPTPFPASISLNQYEAVLEVQGIEKWIMTLQPIGDGDVVMQDPKTKSIFAVRRIMKGRTNAKAR